MKIPDYVERHLQPHLRDTLEPWQLKEVVCLCKQVAADVLRRERERYVKSVAPGPGA